MTAKKDAVTPDAKYEEALGLLKRAATSPDDTTARGLADAASKIFDDLESDHRSERGQFVRNQRPQIRKAMASMRGKPVKHQLQKLYEFWSGAEG